MKMFFERIVHVLDYSIDHYGWVQNYFPISNQNRDNDRQFENLISRSHVLIILLQLLFH